LLVDKLRFSIHDKLGTQQTSVALHSGVDSNRLPLLETMARWGAISKEIAKTGIPTRQEQ
jgi:hypothetical protein